MKTLLLPISPAVRRTSLAAGTIAALFSGGVPFAGFVPSLVMGHAVALPSVLAFFLHLALAVLYGAVLAIFLCRSRDAWTLLAVALGALTLDRTTALLLFSGPIWDGSAFGVHVLFATAFAAIFKLAEIGAAEEATSAPPRAMSSS